MSDHHDSDEPGAHPVAAKQALAQKRDVRQLNTRLEMLVRTYQDNNRANNNLKQVLAKRENEYRNKLKTMENNYKDSSEKLRKENQNLAYQNKMNQQEIITTLNIRKEIEDRLRSSESNNASITSQNESLKQENFRIKDEFDNLRNQYASLKYKYDAYDVERKNFIDRISGYKTKNESLLRDLTQNEIILKQDHEQYELLLSDKNNEIDALSINIKNLEINNSTTQQKLRKEFDSKLADFVQKREDQYKQEKDEWMRIFKEEFNRKLRSFKEANHELSHTNKKQENNIKELRTRISKLKQIKTELEIQNRNLEEEVDKIRTDFDDLRRLKDDELKIKNVTIMELRDRYKAKELQFDELAGIKLQLDAEIELYRNILNEAEAGAGYQSPLLYSETNNGKRKRKRFNTDTPMGPMTISMININNHNNNNNNNNNNDEDEEEIILNLNNNIQSPAIIERNDHNNKKKIITPGIARAAAIAFKDIEHVNSDIIMDKDHDHDDDIDDTDMKSEEHQNNASEYITPGNIEGAELTFSNLDLLKGMIEIQNTGENNVELDSYCLSNQDGTSQFPIPGNVLKPKETLRIYIGKDLKNHIDNIENHQDIIGDYQGQYLFWSKNVWTGKNKDCARLYNPDYTEVSKIEISPDMVPGSKFDQKKCIVM